MEILFDPVWLCQSGCQVPTCSPERFQDSCLASANLESQPLDDHTWTFFFFSSVSSAVEVHGNRGQPCTRPSGERRGVTACTASHTRGSQSRANAYGTNIDARVHPQPLCRRMRILRGGVSFLPSTLSSLQTPPLPHGFLREGKSPKDRHLSPSSIAEDFSDPPPLFFVPLRCLSTFSSSKS